MYIVYIKERYLFSLVCTFRKAIKNFEAKVNVQNMALRFREQFTMNMLVSSNSHFHSLLSYGNSP